MEYKIIGRDERADGIVISSVRVPYFNYYGNYETAVVFEDDIIRIIQGYDTEEECLAGHRKYLNMSDEEFEKIEFID